MYIFSNGIVAYIFKLVEIFVFLFISILTAQFVMETSHFIYKCLYVTCLWTWVMTLSSIFLSFLLYLCYGTTTDIWLAPNTSLDIMIIQCVEVQHYVIHPCGNSGSQSWSVLQWSCLDGHLTKGSHPQTRQATPEFTCPIRGSGSQTGHPRMHITRQAIPGLNVKEHPI